MKYEIFLNFINITIFCCSFDYEDTGYKPAELVKVSDIHPDVVFIYVCTFVCVLYIIIISLLIS